MPKVDLRFVKCLSQIICRECGHSAEFHRWQNNEDGGDFFECERALCECPKLLTRAPDFDA
jgi:hypothetical protein